MVLADILDIDMDLEQIENETYAVAEVSAFLNDLRFFYAFFYNCEIRIFIITQLRLLLTESVLKLPLQYGLLE